MVLAPEHPLVATLTPADRRSEVDAYIGAARRETEIDRLNAEREKTGVFIGAYAVNPLTNERIPIWIADYVLPGYGTGAIMAVPAHDERDYAFARKYELPIRYVVARPPESCRRAKHSWPTPRARCWSNQASSRACPLPRRSRPSPNR